MELIKKLLGSRKFLVMLASVIGLLITKYLKVQVDPDTVLQFVILIGSYIVGEGLAGFGKGAAKVEAITTLTRDDSVSVGDTKKAVEEIKSV
jgi:hypothetical protein